MHMPYDILRTYREKNPDPVAEKTFFHLVPVSLAKNEKMKRRKTRPLKKEPLDSRRITFLLPHRRRTALADLFTLGLLFVDTASQELGVVVTVKDKSVGCIYINLCCTQKETYAASRAASARRRLMASL